MLFEKIVCTREQALQLKKLGISQIAAFYWKLTPITEKWLPIPFTSSTLDLNTDIAAYCDTELAVMLDAFYETFRTRNNNWHGGEPDYRNEFETPAEASAARLISHLQDDDERFTVQMANDRLSNFFKI